MNKNKIRIRKIWLVFAVYVILIGYMGLYIANWQSRQNNLLKYQTLMQHNHISSHSRALLRDMECFPVRKDRRGKVSWDFGDGYGAPRTFGGKRSHEGVDIMASKDQPGCLQIQSVCDGVIEQIGWLKLGGYRIGIRSKQGYYVYYAHLQQYAPDLRKGSKVKAGDYLGLMGNTGYGPEGTSGQFAVHLHFGIYIAKDGREQSMDPYPILWYLAQ